MGIWSIFVLTDILVTLTKITVITIENYNVDIGTTSPRHLLDVQGGGERYWNHKRSLSSRTKYKLLCDVCSLCKTSMWLLLIHIKFFLYDDINTL